MRSARLPLALGILVLLIAALVRLTTGAAADMICNRFVSPSGSDSGSGTTSRSAWRRSTWLTGYSFSSGAIVHVEYTIVPPGRSSRYAASSIRVCRYLYFSMRSSDQYRSPSGRRRSTRPSPEHCTSSRMRSKQPCGSSLSRYCAATVVSRV